MHIVAIIYGSLSWLTFLLIQVEKVLIMLLWLFGIYLTGKLIPKSFPSHPRFVILSLIQHFDPNKYLMLDAENKVRRVIHGS